MKFYGEKNEFSAEQILLPIKSIKTGIDLRDEHLWKHLNIDKFPFAELRNLSAKSGVATGNLIINGVTKNISLKYEIQSGRIISRFKVNSSDFNLKKVEYLGVNVNEVVEVLVDVPFFIKKNK